LAQGISAAIYRAVDARGSNDGLAAADQRSDIPYQVIQASSLLADGGSCAYFVLAQFEDGAVDEYYS
jgi:hypothetical protein